MPTSSMTPPVRRKFAKTQLIPAPGPGHYENNLQKLKFSETAITSSFMVPLELSRSEPEIGPGPGEYANDEQALRVKDKRPAYTMRKKTVFRDIKEQESISPGPAGYSPKELPVAGHQTPWVVSVVEEHKRRPLAADYYSDGEEYTGPGPGSYELSRELEDGPAYTMQFKTPAHSWAADTTMATPGPAAYSHKNYIGKGMSKSISAKSLHVSNRNFGVDPDNPGPGKYLSHSYSHPELQRAPAYTWATEPHTNNPVGRDRSSFMASVRNERVGPATYDPNAIKYKFHNVKKCVQQGRSKVPVFPVEVTPGPNYTPRSIANPLRGKTLAGKNDYMWRMKPNNPGVGTYAYGESHDTVLTRQPSFTMRTKPKKKTTEDIRANGVDHDYKDPKLINNPSHTMVGRRKAKEEFQGPGPGHYNLKGSLFKDKKNYRLN